MKKMKKQFMKIALGILVSGAVITSCKKDKVEENDTEVFTTIAIKLTPVGGGAVLNYQVEDLDGPDGGNAAVAQEIVLEPNKVYNTEIVLLDKTKTPVATVSDEVRTEADDHQFYFTPTAGTNLTVGNLDKDSKGYPLGLSSTWTTGAASTGKIFILLKHKPGIKGANDPSTLGETDIDTQGWFNGFTVKIQ
jgi:hypothetical protein